MHRALHYRELPDHARQLAQATWQDDLEEMLGCLARDFEIADDIEAGATEVRHPELSPSEPTVQPRRSRLRSAHVTTTASGNRRTADRHLASTPRFGLRFPSSYRALVCATDPRGSPLINFIGRAG